MDKKSCKALMFNWLRSEMEDFFCHFFMENELNCL